MPSPHPVIIQLLDAWRACDHEAYVSAFANEFKSMDPYGGVKSFDGMREHIATLEAAWTELDYEITQAASEGDVCAVSFTIHMTGKTEGMEGKRVSMPCMAFVTIENGKIKVWNELFDTGVLRKARKAAA